MTDPGPSPQDIAFARVFLAQRRVTRVQVEECLVEQRRLAAAGTPTTLARLMFARGLVTADEYERTLEQLPDRTTPPARDTHSYRLPEAPLPAPAPRAPRVTNSGRYEPESGEERIVLDAPPERPAAPERPAPPQPEGERTILMSATAVIALPQDIDEGYEVLGDAPPPVDERIRTALGAPLHTDEFDFGAFRVLGLLGVGAMGAVYRARSSETGHVVALKALLRAETATDEQLRKFVLEARTAMELVHPGIIEVVDIGIVEDVAYFAMELIEGADLQAHLGWKTFDPPALLALLADVAEAVDHAHSHGVIHRDLKPANVIIRDRDRSPVLTDFGLAWSAAGGGSAKARVGTPLFMSPEQLRGDEVDGRCDVYALGVMLYLGLTGRPPYVANTRPELDALILAGRPRPPGAGRAVDEVCLKAMAVDRAKRHRTAASLAADLRTAARSLGGSGDDDGFELGD